MHKRIGSYFEQNGCHNCKHCFSKGDYDESPTLFCTFDAPPRPPCGSVSMDESWNDIDAEFAIAHRKWDEWREGREVAPWGKCENWKLGPLTST